MLRLTLHIVLGLFVCFSAASAHNSGMVMLPSGECVPVGSGKPAPLVPESNPNRNTLGPGSDLGRLDLLPGTPGDQYGARFAATRGNSAVEPPSRTTTCTRP